MFPRDPCALRRCNSIPPINPYWKLHTLVVHNFISNLIFLLQDTLKYFGYSENPLCLLPCSSSSSWIPLRIIPRTYRLSAHPQLFRCFAKFFEMPLALPKSSVAYCSWSSLPACIMVTSICQAIFIKILVMNILTILIQHVCECTQSSVDPYKLSFRLGCLPEHELVLDHSNSCRLYP